METATGKDKSKFITLPIVEEKGFVELKRYDGSLPEPEEWESLEYVDWKSGGDTNFAILASANGDHDPRGFWEYGKPDKDGIWTDNIEKSPTIKKWVEDVGANFGRVRIIKLEPNTYEETVKNLHPDDNNRLTEKGTGWVVRAWLQLTDNPDSFMILRDGSVRDIRFVTRSGSFAFDLNAQGAIEAAGNTRAFGPLPEGWDADVLPVSFYFKPTQ
jgi:hypothetical protein